MKRLLATLAGIAATMLLVAAAGSWLLGRWLPRYGQAKLEAAVEERWPVDLSLGTLDYHLVRGLTATDVALTDTTGRVLFSAPEVRLRPRWGGLWLGRIGFGGDADMIAPYRAPLILAGWVHLGGSAWRLDAQTPETPLSALAPVLTERIPTSLTDGRFILRVRMDQSGRGPARAGVQVDGRRLKWQRAPLTAVADITVDGDAAPDSDGIWRYDFSIAMRDGELRGLPAVDMVTDLEGTGRLTPESLRIDRLVGETLDTAWQARGEVSLAGAPAVTVLLTGRPDAGQVFSLWPAGAAWAASGPVDLSASCRGPLAPSPRIDCQIAAELRGVSVTPPMLGTPLTGITGGAGYDLLERRVTIESLAGELAGQPVSARGEVFLTDPAAAAVSVDGSADLHAVPALLSRAGITEASGRVKWALDLDGPVTDPQLRGRVTLEDVSGHVGGQRVDSLTGELALEPAQIAAEALGLQLNGQPVTLAFTATTGQVPLIRATVSLPGGAIIAANTRLLAESVQIESGRLELAHSRLQVSGTVSRAEDHHAAVRLHGVVELADLAAQPWLPLPALAAWQPSGRVEVDAAFDGEPSAWNRAAWRGRLQGEQLLLHHIPVEQLACEFDGRDGAMRLRIPAASVAGGQLDADLSLEPREAGTGFLLKGELAQGQLERLAATLPAWKGRDIRGAMSTAASLSGTWQQRDTWVGEGWLNAAGERLGELPLLEKVFQGFFGVLADRLGLEALRRGQITQAGLHWQLAQGRLQTEDLRLSGTSAGEPVAVYAHGSVGLDQTLDLVIEPELSEGMLLQAPSTASIANTVLHAANRLEKFRRLVGRHRLTGTLKQPQYRFEFSLQDVLRQLAPAPEDLLQGLLNTLGGGQ